MKNLLSKEVDAVVYDRPQLLYYLKNNSQEHLYISQAEYFKQGYSFAFPSNSRINSQSKSSIIRTFRKSGNRKIVHNYIEKDEQNFSLDFNS